MSGADEVFDLADDFMKSAGQIVAELHDAFDEAGEHVEKAWQDGVRASAPKHLPHLPDAITHETKHTLGGVAVEIGPESSKKQGRLGRGEELGSRNQPAHLNGLNAMEAEEAKLEKAADDAAWRLLP